MIGSAWGPTYRYHGMIKILRIILLVSTSPSSFLTSLIFFMPWDECKGPRLQSYDNIKILPYLEYFTKLWGTPGGPTHRPYENLPQWERIYWNFEKFEVDHVGVCNDEENDAASFLFCGYQEWRGKRSATSISWTVEWIILILRFFATLLPFGV